MKLYTTVAVLLLFLVGSTLSDCWIYGHCNPGPNCRNDDNRCWDCRDGGYIHQHQYDNGFADCKSGNDERDEQVLIPTKNFRSMGKENANPDMRSVPRRIQKSAVLGSADVPTDNLS